MTRTDELEPGMRVVLPGGIVRTVAAVEPSGFVNRADLPIYNVLWLEPGDERWTGSGNSGIAASLWEVC
jgi:hypothetical protein